MHLKTLLATLTTLALTAGPALADFDFDHRHYHRPTPPPPHHPVPEIGSTGSLVAIVAVAAVALIIWERRLRRAS